MIRGSGRGVRRGARSKTQKVPVRRGLCSVDRVDPKIRLRHAVRPPHLGLRSKVVHRLVQRAQSVRHRQGDARKGEQTPCTDESSASLRTSSEDAASLSTSKDDDVSLPTSSDDAVSLPSLSDNTAFLQRRATTPPPPHVERRRFLALT